MVSIQSRVANQIPSGHLTQVDWNSFNEVLTRNICHHNIIVLPLYPKSNYMSESFCFFMMVTQMVLFSVFVMGIVCIIGHQIFNLIKK
jgi:L-lactate permease